GFDPVAVFSALATVPCVSFAEYLMYERLTAEFARLRRGLPENEETKLAVSYSAAGQLVVSWRGRPADGRKTVLVAHVDTEGLLVREIDAATSRAICWHTTGHPPELHTLGRRVMLFC